MTVNQFIHKVEWEMMTSSLDIPLLCDGRTIDEIELLEDEDFGYYFNIKTREKIWQQ